MTGQAVPTKRRVRGTKEVGGDPSYTGDEVCVGQTSDNSTGSPGSLHGGNVVIEIDGGGR